MENVINKQIKILLVEDNLINIKVFTTILGDYGYSNITIAKTGENALTLALGTTQDSPVQIKNESNTQLTSATPFDIIFLDIGLPDITGLEVCKKIRQQLPNQSIPIIVLTACGTDAEEESFQAGCSEFFTKPVNAEQLISTIERWSKMNKLESHDYFY